MPQQQGAGTVYTGGPGSAFRGPLYVRGGPSSAGSGNPPSQAKFYNVFDAYGNLVAPATGSNYQEALITIPNANILTLYSAGFQLIAAPGAGFVIDIDTIILDYLYATAAFTAGGAIQANYGTGVAAAATATVAATFLTSPSANQITKLNGSTGMSNLASSAVINTAVYLTCATQNFATGGGSLVALVQYRIVQGMQ